VCACVYLGVTFSTDEELEGAADGMRYNFPEELLDSIASDCKMGESVKTKPGSSF